MITSFNNRRDKIKKVWISILLSVFFPGVGHMYLGNFSLGAVLLVSFYLSYFAIITTKYSAIFAIIMIAIFIITIISVVKETKEYNSYNN